MARTVRTPEEAEAALRELPGGTELLDAVTATAGAWVVGGAVRDALLGREPEEVDVVLAPPAGAGPAAPLEAFAGRLGVPLEPEQTRFGTRTLTTPDGLVVDLVRARRERYSRPGALPEVEPAELDADLARRDVTVNAIALRPGEPLRAVPGALDDLAAGVLRILHPRSFEDDATRLWRVARFGARLGFEPDAETAARAAVADPATVSGSRHGNELRRTLAEDDAVGALQATQALAPQLFPAGFAPRSAADALALLPREEGRPGLVVLARACASIEAARLVAWLNALGFSAAERDVAAAGSRGVTLHPLRSASDAAGIARAARGAPLEVVALAGGAGARRWIEELRHVRLEIDGADLLAAGVAAGPELGARLQRALDARLNGQAPSREAQLRVALS